MDGAPTCPLLGSNEQCIFRRLNWDPSGLVKHFLVQHDFFQYKAFAEMPYEYVQFLKKTVINIDQILSLLQH